MPRASGATSSRHATRSREVTPDRWDCGRLLGSRSQGARQDLLEDRRLGARHHLRIDQAPDPAPRGRGHGRRAEVGPLVRGRGPARRGPSRPSARHRIDRRDPGQRHGRRAALRDGARGCRIPSTPTPCAPRPPGRPCPRPRARRCCASCTRKSPVACPTPPRTPCRASSPTSWRAAWPRSTTCVAPTSPPTPLAPRPSPASQAAIDSLVDHHYDVALTGGMDRNMGATTFVKFSKIGALSPDGSLSL